MITDIRLQNFRSYKDAAFELSSGVNIIVGPNASGKTNLLEALLVIARGQSYRAATTELIAFKADWTRLDAHTKNGGTRTVKLTKNGSAGKKFEIDGKSYSILPIAKTCPVVLFEPQHLLLLTGQPELRRDFMDDLLGQTDAGFSQIRQGYRRALYQRNNLLKKGPAQGHEQLFAWNIRLSELGGQIANARHQLIVEFDKQLSGLYKKLSGAKHEVSIGYHSSIPITSYSSAMLQKLASSEQLDYLRGFTAAGPHRDDLHILLNNHNVHDTASRGEVRTILLGLKILELQILENIRGQKPMLLLDDVFSELDGARRRSLTEFLQPYQTFITTTDADIVTRQFLSKSSIIALSGKHQ